MYYIWDSRSETKADQMRSYIEAKDYLEHYLDHLTLDGARIREQMAYQDEVPKGWSPVYQVTLDGNVYELQIRTIPGT